MNQKKKYGIAIDTTLGGAGLCLVSFEQGKEVASFIDPEEKSGVSKLSSFLADALAHANISVRDIDAVLLGVGPGSFTGIKIGGSFVYGLRQGLGDRAHYWSTSALGLFAESLKLDDEDFGNLVLPATRTRAALARFADNHQDLILEDLDIEKPSSFEQLSRKNTYFVGKWPVLESMLAQRGYGALVHLDAGDVLKKALSLMGEKMLSLNSLNTPSMQLEPLYLRRSSAEEKL